jgi:hypothetical protein
MTSAASPENTPAQPLPPTPWWKFWKGPPETVLARATVVLAVATLMLFIIAVIQAVILATTDVSTRKAADAAVKSAATAKETVNQKDIAQRPWVRLSKPAPVHLSVMDTGVIISLELKAKNIGHSPAEGVYATGKVFPDFSLDKQAPAARTVCEDASNHLEFEQIMIFPDDERHLSDSQFTINMQEIIDRRMEEIAFQYNEGTPYIGKEKAEAKRQEELAKPILDTFTVVGCLVYSYRSGRAYGKTAFVLDIHKLCPETPVVSVGNRTAADQAGNAHRERDGRVWRSPASPCGPGIRRAPSQVGAVNLVATLDLDELRDRDGAESPKVRRHR